MNRSLAASLLALTAVACLGSHAKADSLFSYNVVTANSLEVSNVHLHGTAAVGGSLQIDSISEFGADVTGSGVKVSVAGAITGNSGVYMKFPGTGGSATYGTTLSSNVKFESSGSAAKKAFSASTLVSSMKSDSSAFASLAKNDNYSNGKFSITSSTSVAGLGNTAVFDLTSSDLAVANTNFSLAVNTSVNAIIINVSGTTINESQINFNGNWSSYTGEIIWNFENATTINLSGASWYGTILAPYATLTKTSNDIYGGVYVNNLDMCNGEIHNNLYFCGLPTGSGTGNTPTATPLPASFLSGSLVLAIAGLAAARRRKPVVI